MTLLKTFNATDRKLHIQICPWAIPIDKYTLCFEVRGSQIAQCNWRSWVFSRKGLECLFLGSDWR